MTLNASAFQFPVTLPRVEMGSVEGTLRTGHVGEGTYRW